MYHPAAWSTRPVFLSSPFLDFHAERDCLRDVVFPELQDLLRGAKRRLHLALVDLRMGVETGSLADEEQKDCFILKVCLEEVDRCRPFFIVLLGDRYNSIMPSARISEIRNRPRVCSRGLIINPCETDRGSRTLLDEEHMPA